MTSTYPPYDSASETADPIADLLVRLDELPKSPPVLELRAAARNAANLRVLGLLSPVEEATLAIDLDLAVMQISREVEDGADSG